MNQSPELKQDFNDFVEECAKNDIFRTKYKSLVKLQHFRQKKCATLPKDTYA